MTKVIRIVENNHITGVVYGTVEIQDNKASHKQNYNQMVSHNINNN